MTGNRKPRTQEQIRKQTERVQAYWDNPGNKKKKSEEVSAQLRTKDGKFVVIRQGERSSDD